MGELSYKPRHSIWLQSPDSKQLFYAASVQKVKTMSRIGSVEGGLKKDGARGPKWGGLQINYRFLVSWAQPGFMGHSVAEGTPQRCQSYIYQGREKRQGARKEDESDREAKMNEKTARCTGEQ